MLDEALRQRRAPGVVFVDGPTGRRAVIAGTGLEVTNAPHHGVLLVPRSAPNNHPERISRSLAEWAARFVTGHPGSGFVDVPIPAGGRVTGVVLADQIQSVDHGARRARRLGAAPTGLLDDVLAIVDAVLF